MFVENLTIPILIGAALLDSINPCVFGVLIFLIAFMAKVYKSPHRMLIGGLLYTIVVYVSYLLLGIGFLKFTVSFGFSQILEIKDFFWYGKGLSLKMIPGADQRIKYFTTKIEKLNKKSVWLSYAAAGMLGVFVVLVELPCTGAPYLAVLAILGEGNYAQGIPLLLLYNLIFILPLFVIIGISYFGKSSQALEAWRLKHRGLMRLAVGLFLIGLGSLMIYTIW